jgi:hypothetical protein
MSRKSGETWGTPVHLLHLLKAKYFHITQGEMRQIMKAAVDRVYTFLVLKERDPKAYEALLSLGKRYTAAWDEPVLMKNL